MNDIHVIIDGSLDKTSEYKLIVLKTVKYKLLIRPVFQPKNTDIFFFISPEKHTCTS